MFSLNCIGREKNLLLLLAIINILLLSTVTVLFSKNIRARSAQETVGFTALWTNGLY